MHTVKSANSASPFKFRQSLQILPGQISKKKTGLENDKISFSQRKTEYDWNCL